MEVEVAEVKFSTREAPKSLILKSRFGTSHFVTHIFWNNMKPFSRVSRHIFTPRSPQLRQSQRRWAQVHNVRFVATEQFEARVLEKYRDKLERKAREFVFSIDSTA